MQNIDVAIELVIPDNTAFTVLETLRSLGYAELCEVVRADHVFLAVEDGDSALTVAQKVSHAEVLFNPNKHRLRYASVAGATMGDRPGAKRDPDEFELEALVQEKDEDNGRLLTALSRTFGIGGLRRVERAVEWRLHEPDRPAPRERLAWACEALLANPISQTYRIRKRPEYHALGEPAAGASKATR